MQNQWPKDIRHPCLKSPLAQPNKNRTSAVLSETPNRRKVVRYTDKIHKHDTWGDRIKGQLLHLPSSTRCLCISQNTHHIHNALPNGLLSNRATIPRDYVFWSLCVVGACVPCVFFDDIDSDGCRSSIPEQIRPWPWCVVCGRPGMWIQKSEHI